MFTLLIHPESGLPHVVSLKSNIYTEFIDAGYIEIHKGRKRDMLDSERELLEEIYQTD